MDYSGTKVVGEIFLNSAGVVAEVNCWCEESLVIEFVRSA